LSNDHRVVLVEADPNWAIEFERIASLLSDAVGADAARIDHIGSTSVPGLASKDVIDVQITVPDAAALERAATKLEALGWPRGIDFSDHPVPGLPGERSHWQKEFFDEPPGERAIHVHVRIDGRANQRYALLVRDYLRAHPDAAAAYLDVKRGLAELAPNSDAYADAKDPACDLIYLAAERWAAETGWPPERARRDVGCSDS
jgi:dephospho-CoA kinase